MLEKYVFASELDKIENCFTVLLSLVFDPVPKMYGISGHNYSYLISIKYPNILQPLRFRLSPFYTMDPIVFTSARVEEDINVRNDPPYNGSKAIILKSDFRKLVQSKHCIVMAYASYG